MEKLKNLFKGKTKDKKLTHREALEEEKKSATKAKKTLGWCN